MNQLRKSCSTVGAFVATLALVGCQNPAQPMSGRTAEPVSPSSHVAAAPTSDTAAKTTTVAASESWDPSKLDDAQIGAVLDEYNGGEVQRAELAQERASASDVKAFAARAKKEHSSMRDDDQAAFSKNKVLATTSPVSDRMRTRATTELESLKAKTGVSFDDAYMKDEVKADESAAVLIDRMLDNAKEADVRDRLNKDHARIEDELTDALRIERAPHKGMTNMQGKEAQ